MPQVNRCDALGVLLAIGFYFGFFALLALVWWPLCPLFLAFLLCIWILDSRRVARFNASRLGESICDFARSFNPRAVDTWIIRAVHEGLSESHSFPIRPSDRFEHDLWMDSVELDFFAMDVAKRAGRNLEDTEHNPLFGQVRTVKDLVMFLSHQPLVKKPRRLEEA